MSSLMLVFENRINFIISSVPVDFALDKITMRYETCMCYFSGATAAAEDAVCHGAISRATERPLHAFSLAVLNRVLPVPEETSVS